MCHVKEKIIYFHTIIVLQNMKRENDSKKEPNLFSDSQNVP